MERRKLGASGIEVSVLSFGLMTFSDGDPTFDTIGNTHAEEAGRQVAIARECGVNLFDTSDNYAAGQSEEILGKALGPARKEVLVATKVFGRTGSGADDVGLSRQHVIAACEASLRRLGTDWIDLYQIHNHDSLVPVEETLCALNDLVRAGKVRFIGCSNHFAWQVMKALGISSSANLPRFVSHQFQYSLLVRDAEHEILPIGVDQNLAGLIYSPLAQGYLSGKFSRERDPSSRLIARGQLRHFDHERGRSVVATLAAVAARHSAMTVAQAALAWLLSRPGVTSLVFGARSEKQLRENLEAARCQLAPSDIDELDRTSAPAPLYPRTAQDIFHPERNPSLFPRRPPA